MLSISPINSNMQHKRNEPSFKQIHINQKIPNEFVEMFANSKYMDEIAKIFDIDVIKYSWNKQCDSYFLDLNISRIKEAITPAETQKSSNNFFSRLFKSVEKEKTTSENKFYQMNLTDKYISDPEKKHPSFKEQIEAFTPQSIEEFVKSEELKEVQRKAEAIEDKLKREENLKKIANFGK